MTEKLDLQMVHFKPETLSHFGGDKKVDTQVYEAMGSLIARSREAIAVLGEFTSEELDDRVLLDDEEDSYYHPSRFCDLEHDLSMFEDMLQYMLKHEDNPDCFVGVYPQESDKSVLTFSLGDQVDTNSIEC